jgi:hypothetical protein
MSVSQPVLSTVRAVPLGRVKVTVGMGLAPAIRRLA